MHLHQESLPSNINVRISKISDRATAVVNVQELALGLLFLYFFNNHAEVSQKLPK